MYDQYPIWIFEQSNVEAEIHAFLETAIGMSNWRQVLLNDRWGYW